MRSTPVEDLEMAAIVRGARAMAGEAGGARERRAVVAPGWTG